MRMKILGLLAFGILVGGLAARADEPTASKSGSSCCRKAKADTCSGEAKAAATCCPCERTAAKPDTCGRVQGDSACCKASAACSTKTAARCAATTMACGQKAGAPACCPAKPGSCASRCAAKPAAEGCSPQAACKDGGAKTAECCRAKAVTK